jgi:PAS domain S-box-containing protein
VNQPTELHAAQIAVTQRALRLFAPLYGPLPVAIAVLDATQRPCFANDAARRLASAPDMDATAHDWVLRIVAARTQIAPSAPLLMAEQRWEVRLGDADRRQDLAVQLREIELDGLLWSVLTIEDRSTDRDFQREIQRLTSYRGVLLAASRVGVAHVIGEQIVEANTELANMLGYESGALAGRGVPELFASDRAWRRIQERSIRALAHDSVFTQQCALRTHDGRELPALVHVGRMDARDPEQGLLITAEDVTRHKATTRLLDQAATELAAIFSNSAIGIVHLVRDAGGTHPRAVRVNRQMEVMLGAGRDELMGTTVDAWMDAEQAQILREAAGRAIALGEHFKVKVRLRRLDGTALDCLSHGGLIHRERPEDGILVAFLDISEQARAEAQLAEAERRFAFFANNTDLGITIHEAGSGRIVLANPGYERLVGVEQARLEAQPRLLRSRVHPDDLAEFDALQDAIAQARADTRAYRLIDLEGQQRWVSTRIEATRLPDGRTFAYAMSSDVTTQKARQEQLSQTIAEQEQLFKAANVGIVFVKAGRIARANPAFEQMLRAAPGGLIGQSFGDIFPEAVVFSLRPDGPYPVLDEGNVYTVEVQLKRTDASTFWGDVSGRALDAGNPAAGYLFCCLDVDERHRSEERLRETTAFLDLVLDNMPMLISVRDAETSRLLRMNPAAADVFTPLQTEALPMPDATALATARLPEPPLRATGVPVAAPPGTLMQRILEADRRVMRDSVVVDDEGEVSAPNGGGTRTFRTRTLPVFNSLGQCKYLLSLSEDITERKQAELALRESEARFRQFAEQTDQLIYIYDQAAGELLYHNDRLEEVLGLSTERVLSERLSGYENVIDAHQDRVAAMQAVDLRHERTDVELSIGHPRKGERVLRWLRFAVTLASGSLRVFGMVEDVTELKQVEAQRLEEALRQRDLLIREVHHRIKNNLQGVAGLMQQIALQKPHLRDDFTDLAAKVQAIAQVHGIQMDRSGMFDYLVVARAILGGVERMYGGRLDMRIDTALSGWMLPEQESVPISLAINELASNAVRHRDGKVQGIPVVELVADRLGEQQAVRLHIRNAGRLPQGFDFQSLPPGVTGLSLLKALLPRRGCQIRFGERVDDANQAWVEVDLVLAPPALRSPAMHTAV